MAIPFPDIDPVALAIGPVEIRWYALAYLAGFLLGWRYAIHLCRLDQNKFRPNEDDIDDFMTWAILGILLGGRLGYVLFYNFGYYLDNPGDILKLWHGGMAFHGGLIGVIAVTIGYSLYKKISVLRLGDIFACSATFGFFFGRVANFINGELYGRPTDVPWAMVFPGGGPEPRHPSQLYQAGLEGIALFLILAALAHVQKIRHTPGTLTAVFLFFYGLFRFIVEFFRMPDQQLGLVLGPLSMGQVLCLPMMAGAFVIAAIANRYSKSHAQPA